MDEVLVTFTDEDGREGLKIVHPTELHGYTLTPPEPLDPKVIKRVEEWEKECGPLPKPPAGMFPWREPVVVETPKRSGVEVDERGFYLIDGLYVPDTEAGRLRLQYALMNERMNHENESIQGRSADCEPRQPDDERDRGNS